MFTGIIEEIGTLKQVKQGTKDYQLTIAANKILTDVQLGDSIAVNGVCLTVTSFTAQQFTVDVMPETIKATSLQHVERGSAVNLERAMSANGRFGGHFVSGHVDGTGVITSKREVSNAVYYWIEVPQHLIRYIVPKGSICVDGISLTVVEVNENQFSISIIPHTITETILQFRNVGHTVNIECDMLAKYMERLLDARSEKPRHAGLTMQTLADNGYI
ncbi:riboflavin synthase [Caldalkalibacillus mannanilyticus]|uniref:riboflavin synthase n=1 Tax=Caldalkalibacillus mannanilyticus TaxID=1418 RepID=UPI00046AC380|nr:riboflavin synthase [Caldalkalibacillus mannanilyticus]